ncbi:beta-ketoacyl-ACP synthase 3 [bacterium AH-315-C20]|nr:beta-ketoacyl-ACP synthase 3 [bacterium AH-315-C20]
MNAKIIGTGSAVPSTIVTNAEINDNPDWVSKVLGVDERRKSGVNELSSDLAFEAAKSCLEAANISAEEIDLIIVATISPDKLTPSTACILQEKLQANQAVAFDLSAACSGFVYAFITAAQFISSRYYNYALVIGVDTLTRYTDWDSRDAVYFGDGAGAAILTYSDSVNILASKMRSDGNCQDHYVIAHNDTFKMDGVKVTEFACANLPPLIDDVLEAANMAKSDIDLVISHQPSLFALQKVAEAANMPFDKFRSNLKNYSNTASASVPLLLDQVVRNEGIEKGSKVLFLGVGAGMTVGAAIYEW